MLASFDLSFVLALMPESWYSVRFIALVEKKKQNHKPSIFVVSF